MSIIEEGCFFTDGGSAEMEYVIAKKSCEFGEILKRLKDLYEKETGGIEEVKYLKETDIEEKYVRYYPKTPEHLQYEFGDDGLYMFCKKGRGAIPVWVIEIG